MKLTREQFDTLLRREEPEVFTEQQMSDWIIKSADLINKGDMNELSDAEKLDAEKFGSQYKSFVRVTVVDAPGKDDLNKGMKYTNFYLREKQAEQPIEKSIQDIEKSENDDIEKGGKAKIGETHTWGGKKYRKEREGHWVEVSEHGHSKAEHLDKYDEHHRAFKEALKKKDTTEAKYHQEKANQHWEASEKVSDKYHSDNEVNFGKEEEVKLAHGITGKILEKNGMRKMTANDYRQWAGAPENAYIKEDELTGVTVIYGDEDGNPYITFNLPTPYGEFVSTDGKYAAEIVRGEMVPEILKRYAGVFENHEIDADDLMDSGQTFEDYAGKKGMKEFNEVNDEYGLRL